jgi:DnaK suppressor protein
MPMTKNELKRFRIILMAGQAELENAIRNREALVIDTSPGELDRIQHATEREMAIDNLERQSDRLRDVQAALRRIDVGTFGTCLDCEVDISLKRLAAVPWTASCIVCQEAADRNCRHPSPLEQASIIEGPLIYAA